MAKRYSFFLLFPKQPDLIYSKISISHFLIPLWTISYSRNSPLSPVYSYRLVWGQGGSGLDVLKSDTLSYFNNGSNSCLSLTENSNHITYNHGHNARNSCRCAAHAVSVTELKTSRVTSLSTWGKRSVMEMFKILKIIGKLLLRKWENAV